MIPHSLMFRSYWLTQFAALFLFTGTCEAAITNREELQNGVCHGDTLKLHCNHSCLSPKFHWSRGSENEIGPCYIHDNNPFCTEKSKYHVTEKLTYTTNITTHYERDITNWTCHVTCRDKPIEKDSILVKPCSSGFRVSSHYNSALKTLDISVTHQDFNLSNGIQLRNSASSNELTFCQWKGNEIACTPPPAGYSVKESTFGFTFTIHDVPPSSTYNYTLFMDGQTKQITVNSSISPPINQSNFLNRRISFNRASNIEFEVVFPCLAFVILATISTVVMWKKRKRLREWLMTRSSNYDTVRLQPVPVES